MRTMSPWTGGLRLLHDWHRDVPRLSDRLAKTVIYLYSSAETAEAGEETGGSGFIVGQPTQYSPDTVFLWAVTNWHVAHRGRPVIRTAGPRGNRVIERSSSDWVRQFGHDLVATPMGFALRDDPDSPLSYVPREWFVEREDFVRPRTVVEASSVVEPYEMPYGPGDETATLGRFFGYQGREENEPVARFGNLAVQGEVPIFHKIMAVDQPSVLVEARSLSGYSGSPVFIYRVWGPFGGVPMIIRSPRFLGIDWGHLMAPPAGESAEYWVAWAGDPEEPDPVRYNSGVMAVIPAWHLADLLDSEEAVEIQRREEQKAKQASRQALPDG